MSRFLRHAGTANTMSAISESLGMSLMGSSAIPAVLAARMAKGVETGEKIVELVKKGITTGIFLQRML